MADMMPVEDMVVETMEKYDVDRATAGSLVRKIGRGIAALDGQRWPFPGGGQPGGFVHNTWLAGMRRTLDAHFTEVREHDELAAQLATASSRVRELEEELRKARLDRDDLINWIGELLPVTRVAAVTGLGRQRIYQIRNDENR